ncbi:hypothetical protein ACN47E_008290 [Coniothyrium glycines]
MSARSARGLGGPLLATVGRRYPVINPIAFAQVRRNTSATAALQEVTNAKACENETLRGGLNFHGPTATTVLGDRTSKQRTPRLDKLLGKENMAQSKALISDSIRLKNELKLVSARQHLHTKHIGSPYWTRTHFQLPQQHHDVHVHDSKVIVDRKTIPNIWLRDNCQCNSCVHDATKQRLIDTFSIPKNIAITNYSIKDDGFTIEWSDGHASSYSREFLGNLVNTMEQRSIIRQGLSDTKLWDSTIASAHPPIVQYDQTEGDRIITVLRKIRKYGFCYIDNTPFEDPTTTKQLLERISFIRETHYGGFYDFTADLASNDTAYTNIALEAHTDTTYFSDPAGLQAFHLLSHTDGSGGASLLVDGFHVARELHRTDPAAYNILATVNVHAHASGNEGISIQPYRSFPVLEHDTATGDLLRVRWNSSDRAAIELPIEDTEKWYDAARQFDALLKKKENEYWEQLTPGRVLIFDNWRVLHGRSAFTGKRRICGGYVNRDDWMSKYKMLEFGREKVLGNLAAS